MKIKTIQRKIQGNLTVTLYLKALPMNNGINFRAMEALRTASYKHSNNKKKTIYKIRDGGGITTGFHISHYIDKCICLQRYMNKKWVFQRIQPKNAIYAQNEFESGIGSSTSSQNPRDNTGDILSMKENGRNFRPSIFSFMFSFWQHCLI
jgi:hypothetical protein